jgi:hypothetical protein
MRLLILTLSLLPACILRPVPGDSTSTSTADSTSTTPATTTTLPTSTLSPTNTSTSDISDPGATNTTDTTTLDFIIKPDGFIGPSVECDGVKQLDPECPAGQKCTIDEQVSSTHCVDVVDDPKGLYEPCTRTGAAFGDADDCDLGLLCWDVDERGNGTCIGLCDGSFAEGCDCVDPKANLSICQECAVGLCLPGCDPLIQDCPGDELCVPSGGAFLCVIDASGDEGQTNDPCEFINSCDKGLVCLPITTASSACMQDSGSCCQPFCDLGDDTPCPNPDQKCQPWFDPMMEIPAGMEDVGVCAIPA